MQQARAWSLCFAAGALGGAANALAVWASGALGWTRLLGVAIAPAPTPEWLYPRIVWGGLWGLAFLLPYFRTGWIRRGLWLSLGPSAVQLFLVFPLRTSHGPLGLGLGALTPVAVLAFNAVWGIAASGWLQRVRA